MFEKMKQANQERLEKLKVEKAERKRIAREKAEEEERIRKEKIQAEKDALMLLSEKELMVEIVMELRGYDDRFDDIDNKQNNIQDSIDSIGSEMYTLESGLDNLNNNY